MYSVCSRMMHGLSIHWCKFASLIIAALVVLVLELLVVGGAGNRGTGL
jgi:hypothetical protein